jgi:hypothetical protein
MKDKFVTAKIVKLPWIDQFIFLPGAFYCCIMAPVIALISGQDHLFGWPISTWILIGISLLLYAIIERLAHFYGLTGRNIPRKESFQGRRRGIS